MENVIKNNHEETLKLVNSILKEIVPSKVTEDVTLDTAINGELALDSVELMDVLLNIRDEISRKKEDVDVDKLLEFLFKAGEGDAITVEALCSLIEELS